METLHESVRQQAVPFAVMVVLATLLAVILYTKSPTPQAIKDVTPAAPTTALGVSIPPKQLWPGYISGGAYPVGRPKSGKGWYYFTYTYANEGTLPLTTESGFAPVSRTQALDTWYAAFPTEAIQAPTDNPNAKYLTIYASTGNGLFYRVFGPYRMSVAPVSKESNIWVQWKRSPNNPPRSLNDYSGFHWRKVAYLLASFVILYVVGYNVFRWIQGRLGKR